MDKEIAVPEKLTVRSIIEEKGNYARVVVAKSVFDAVNGFKPLLPYETSRNAAGQGVRIFNIDGTKLYSRKDKETGKTIFVMNTEDAKANLVTLDEERAGEPSLEFDF